MRAQANAKLSAEAYLAAERVAHFRSEFWLGEVFAMAGGVEAHAVICNNLNAAAKSSLRGKPCQAFGSDMKVGVAKRRGFAYPDLTIACGERKYYDEVRDVLMNPLAIFEVLSDSTREFDATGKFREYQRLESLRHYVMVEPRIRLVVHYERMDDGRWVYREIAGAGDSLALQAVGIDMPLAQIYDGVELPDRDDAE